MVHTPRTRRPCPMLSRPTSLFRATTFLLTPPVLPTINLRGPYPLHIPLRQWVLGPSSHISHSTARNPSILSKLLPPPIATPILPVKALELRNSRLFSNSHSRSLRINNAPTQERLLVLPQRPFLALRRIKLDRRHLVLILNSSALSLAPGAARIFSCGIRGMQDRQLRRRRFRDTTPGLVAIIKGDIQLEPRRGV